MYIEDNYLYIPEYLGKPKKITGHPFVALAGLDPYTLPGDAILERARIYKPQVDPKWLRRGTLAEQIVQTVYRRDHQIAVYNAELINWDNFPDDPNFGGLIDIELPQEHTLVEVKSKSLRAYDGFEPPLYEVYQAMLYADLRGYKEFTMEWIFFDPETEQAVFNDKPYSTLKNIKRITKTYPVAEDFSFYKKRAKEHMDDFVNYKRIPLDQISPKVLQELRITK